MLHLVRTWGGSTSDALLDPEIQIFRSPECDGFIGYHMGHGNAVIFGDPVCPDAQKAQLAARFNHFLKAQGKGSIYVACSLAFARQTKNSFPISIEFGQERYFEAPRDPRKNSGTHSSLVRRKVKQALSHGVKIEEYLSHDPAIEKAIDELGKAWQASREGLQAHISNVYLFDNREGKRWFYAMKGDQIVGTITLNHLQARQGWLINHLMVTEDAPNGISEFLMAFALERLEKEGCPYATVGITPDKDLGPITGLSAVSSFFVRHLFNFSRKLLRLDNLTTFWSKFDPKTEPAYLLFSRKRIGIAELLSLKKTLSRGS